MTDDKAAAFAGTLAEFYNRYLVPASLFAPLTQRLWRIVRKVFARVVFWRRLRAPAW